MERLPNQPPESAYAVQDGELVPENESRLRREMRLRKVNKTHRHALTYLKQVRARREALERLKAQQR